MARVFKTKVFRKFQNKEGITDADLCEAIDRAERGLIDADLGRGLIKQRVARKGQGRSGGYRTIVAYRVQRRAFFIFGFAKSQRANLDRTDENDLADYGAYLMKLSDVEIENEIADDALWEVDCD